jgi:hypothetical protein
MGRGQQRSASSELAKLKDAVSRWREAGGGRGTKIPEGLWKEAVRLARIDGVWWTASVLRFKYESLKRRMELDRSGDRERAAGRAAREIPPTAPRARRARTTPRSTTRVARRALPSTEFVELAPLAGASRSAPSSTSTTGTVIEVADPAGVRLVVRLAKDTRVDVATLISVFHRRCGRSSRGA